MAVHGLWMKLTEEEWDRHLAAWRESGESTAAYCDTHGLKASAMRYWSSRQRRKARESEGSGVARGFAKVRRRGGGQEPACVCIVVGDARVEVSPSFDAVTLRRALEVLGALGGRR